jgi:SAM-dependent methyltransferase
MSGAPAVRASADAELRASYVAARRARWDEIARALPKDGGLPRAYHRRLQEIYAWLVPPGQRVLEVGCGTGDLLASVQAKRAVGVDLSPAMLAVARSRHPGIELIEADAQDLAIDEQFDFIIVSDLVNDLWDVQSVFERLRPLCHDGTRVLINAHSHLWRVPLGAAQRLGVANRLLPQNWLTVEDITNLLDLTGFDVVRSWDEVLCPLPVPGLAPLANRVLVKSWPFRLAALTHMIVARPDPARRGPRPAPTVSVIVPARNESGNIDEIFTRLPRMGRETELIFVEGHSKDDTLAAIERGIAAHPEWRASVYQQTGEGKGDAVRLGFARASGDVLLILDADLTVAPEDLPRFVDALASGRGEFINGVRLVYPMEEEAMRFFNLLGNKFFSLAFSWLLGQPIKDTLCGTKVLWRRDYERIVEGRSYFGDFDPFGDFDLLFGAAKLSRKIVEMPIRYRQRVYGETNIRRWSHGWLLLKMSAFAARRMKWV